MTEDSSLGALVNRAARLFRRFADCRLEPLGLAAGQLPILTALIARESLSQKALTEHAAIEQPTMAATLARMERDGIIERNPDPRDGRGALFSLAPSTREKAGALRATVEGMSADALADLPKADHDAFRAMLRIVIATLERELRG